MQKRNQKYKAKMTHTKNMKHTQEIHKRQTTKQNTENK